MNMKIKWDNLSNESKASIAFLIAGVIQKGIQMLVTPVFTRIMTSYEFGIYSSYNAWYQIIYIFATLRIAAGVYTQGLVKFENDRDRFQASMLGLSGTIIGIFAFILLALKDLFFKITGVSSILLYAMLIDFFADVVYQLWQRREVTEVRWRALIAISVINTFLTSILGIYGVIHSSFKVEARVITSVGVNVILFFPLMIKQLKRSCIFYNRFYWKYAITFCVPLIPHYLAQVILNQSDRIMINSICGPSEAGIYSLAYSLAFVMQIVNDAINKTLDPWLFKQIKYRNYTRMEDISYKLMIIVGVLNLFLVLFAPEIIYIFAPREYYGAIWVIPPVSCSVYFIFMYNFFADFEFYYEKTKWISVASILGAILNVFLNAFLIPRFGYIAAGYTTLICYLIYVVAHFLFMRRICYQELDGNKIYDGKVIACISIGVIIAVCICMILYKHIFLKYILITVILITLFLKKKR